MASTKKSLWLIALALAASAGFDFKWADHVGPLADPMFLQGDAAPNRRFNYRFVWKR